MSEEIVKKAKELLKTKQVELIIGYRRGPDGTSAMPAFISREEDAENLIWDAYCVYNLANYLKDFPGKKIGIIAKECDVRSIIVLLQENQLKREDVFIIGVECSGVIAENKLTSGKASGGEADFDEKCKACRPSSPRLSDFLVTPKEQPDKVVPPEDNLYQAVLKFEAKSGEERFKFWEEEFSRCIRCYACRQICPMCYCPRCVADQTTPAWFTRATDLKGNLAWNVTRALHLAGRCIDCGECERACPVGIPLRDINQKVEKDIKELFDYAAGADVEQKPLLSSFDRDDPGDFIR